MTYEVDVQNADHYVIDTARLRAAATNTLTQEKAAPNSALTIVLVDDDEIKALNRQFRGVDAPTDVLSFPADVPPAASADEPPYLGDIVIAYPYASAQAARERHDLVDSLVLLTVHGVLHLLGLDHETPEQRAAMWAAQEKALQALGVSPAIVPALEDYADQDDE